MAKATIKSKSGAVITVEGSQAEVSSILTAYERSSVVGQAKEAIARSRAGKKNEKRREGAADIIVALREARFFDTPKELGEIAAALEEKGYLTHSVDGRTFIYKASDARQNVAVRAVKGIIDRFCGGSAEMLVLGMVDNAVLNQKQLERLARKIAERKQEGEKS